MAFRPLPTGDPGLDEILRGGLPKGSIHPVQTPPGAGKTTLALQFLIEGREGGETGLYVTLSRTASELHDIAASHGRDPSGIELVEPQSAEEGPVVEQTIFHTADLGLDRTREVIEAAVARVGPDRMVYDSLLEVRVPAQDVARFHREMIGLRAFTAPRGITVRLLDTLVDATGPQQDARSRGLVHGIVTLASLHAAAALGRGERVALFLFEERLETFLQRCEGLGIELRGHVEAGRLKVFAYTPDAVSPGEFSQIVQAEAEADGLGMVVIDPLTGCMASLGDEAQALFDIQSLVECPAHRGILTIVVVAQRGLLGAEEGGSRLDPSLLGDTVLLLRVWEDGAAVRRSIAPVKKRHGPHAMDVCELVIRPGGIEVGPSASAV